MCLGVYYIFLAFPARRKRKEPLSALLRIWFLRGDVSLGENGFTIRGNIEFSVLHGEHSAKQLVRSESFYLLTLEEKIHTFY